MPKFNLALLTLVVSLHVSAQEITLPCDEKEAAILSDTSDNQVKRMGAFTPAKVIDRVSPQYPRSAAKRGDEGWVKMSYVIDENGDVQDAVIDDFGGSRYFKSKALKALEGWKFEPAMKDGKPTQQCHQAVQFDFVLEGAAGASRRFISRYHDVEELIEKKEFAKAEAELAELRDDAINRYENAWLWNIDAMLAEKQGQTKRELSSYSRLLSSSKTHEKGKHIFSDDYIAFIRQRIFLLSAHFGDYASAIDAFDALKEMEGQAQRLEQIAPTMQKIRDHIASDKHIFVDEVVDESGFASHTLSRQQFAFSDIQGELETVDVRCEAHREKFTVAQNNIWHIPESWGQCRVLVSGSENSTFTLIEVAESQDDITS